MKNQPHRVNSCRIRSHNAWRAVVVACLITATAPASSHAQATPSKEYIRLGSRVIAIESATSLTLTPTGETNASSEGEPQAGQPAPTITIAGQANSSWSATASSTGDWIHITNMSSGTTDTSGMATLTYSLDTNTAASDTPPRTGSITVEIGAATAVYEISQLSGGTISLSLTPMSVALQPGSSSSVAVATSPTTLPWTVSTPPSCFSSVMPLSGTGNGTISYTLTQNSFTTCSFTVSATGASPQTFTVTQSGGSPSISGNPASPATFTATGGQGVIAVSNWTGWTLQITGTQNLVSITSQTSGEIDYTVAANNPGTATLTFSGGTPNAGPFTFTINESSSGGNCSAPTVSRTSMSFPATGGNGQHDPTDYSVLVSAPTGEEWAASCTAGGEDFSYYLNNGTPVTCASQLNGTGTETLFVDLNANRESVTQPLTATINVSACNGTASAPQISVTQSPNTVSMTPSSVTIYSTNSSNGPVQFTAFWDGGSASGHQVRWSLDNANAGSIDSNNGLYSPPTLNCCNFTQANVILTVDNIFTASAPIQVLANPYAPEVRGVSVNGTYLSYIQNPSGSGADFGFLFQPEQNGIFVDITDLQVAFSQSVGGTAPNNLVNACEFEVQIVPAYNMSLVLSGSPGGSASVSLNANSNGIWTSPALWSSQCSTDLSQDPLFVLVNNMKQPVALIDSASYDPPFQFAVPLQFYPNFSGPKGIWTTQVTNAAGVTLTNLLMGDYTVVAPSESISPSATMTLNFAGQTQQFTAMASGTTIPDTTTWKLQPNLPNAGNIDSSGMYHAPTPLTTAQTVSISAVRQSDGTTICCGTIQLSPVSIDVSPANVTLYAGQMQQFTVTVGGASNQDYSWSMPGFGMITQGGLYSAPLNISTQQQFMVTATSSFDPTKTASVVITLIPVAVSSPLSPASASLQINQSQMFTATVTGTSNQTLNWSLSPPDPSSTIVNGLYTAPSSIPTARTVTVTATSAADPTQSSSAQVSLIADTLTISPASVTLGALQSQQFTAVVSGTNNTYVTWSMSPSVGTLSTGGYYTAPSSITSQQTIVITATSQADASLVKSVNVTLIPFTTITTSPPGLPITVDGMNYTAPQTFQWTAGTFHDVAVSSPIAGGTGTQYVFANWSDAGAQSHQITVLSSATTYTANFKTQYWLTTAAIPTTEGSISPSNAAFYDAGTVISISATANSGYQFTGFSGALDGSATPQNLTLNAPSAVTANFIGYAYTRVVTISHSQVPNTGQSNFPFLFNTTDPMLRSTANGGHVTSANGYDIIFTSDAGGSQKLNHEIESYDPTTGKLVAWVQVPTVSHSTDTPIYLFYGDSGITTSQENKSGVWDSNYVGVYHLPNGTILSANDSTSNGNNGTAYGGTTAVAGQIDGAASLDGSTGYISTSTMAATSAITVSAWFNASTLTSDNQRIVSSILTSLYNKGFDLIVENGGATGSFSVGNGSTHGTATWSQQLATGTWYYYVGTYDGSTVTAYLNGVAVGSASFSGQISPSPAKVNLGRNPSYSGDFLSGIIDEARVSTTARSADWVATEYNNQANPTTFYNLGGESIN